MPLGREPEHDIPTGIVSAGRAARERRAWAPVVPNPAPPIIASALRAWAKKGMVALPFLAAVILSLLGRHPEMAKNHQTASVVAAPAPAIVESPEAQPAPVLKRLPVPPSSGSSQKNEKRHSIAHVRARVFPAPAEVASAPVPTRKPTANIPLFLPPADPSTARPLGDRVVRLFAPLKKSGAQ